VQDRGSGVEIVPISTYHFDAAPFYGEKGVSRGRLLPSGGVQEKGLHGRVKVKGGRGEGIIIILIETVIARFSPFNLHFTFALKKRLEMNFFCHKPYNAIYNEAHLQLAKAD
jgi:hypothetical protein